MTQNPVTMVELGNFLFHYRNGLFLVVYVVLLLPSPPVLPQAGWALALGILCCLAGQLLRAATIGLAYIKRGGRDRRVDADDLVTRGIFAHSRNPLYLGNLLILLGVGLAINSLWFLLSGWAFFLLAYHAIARAEEAFLLKKFGPAYEAYCQATPRFSMRFNGLPATLRSMRFSWSRLIVKEYGTTFAWTAGLVAVSYLRSHLFVHKGFGWEPPDTLLAGLFAGLLALYLLARSLKKLRILRADA